MGKIETLSDYIKKCEDIIEANSNEEAEKLYKTVCSAYQYEIAGLKEIIPYPVFSFAMSKKEPVDYLRYLPSLKAKLIAYRDDVEIKISASTPKDGNTFNISQQQNSSNTAIATNEVTFEQTIKLISEIELNVLSEEDQKILQDKLLSLEELRNVGADKNTKWEIAKNILVWIADKSVDAGIAALPFILTALK